MKIINSNLLEIIEVSGEQIVEPKLTSKFIISRIKEEDAINFKWKNGVSLLSAVIKHNETDLIWVLLKKLLPESQSIETNQENLNKLLNKDSFNMNFIDYAFLKNKNMVHDYIANLMNSDQVNNTKLPKLLKINIEGKIKSKEKIKFEKAEFKKLKKLISEESKKDPTQNLNNEEKYLKVYESEYKKLEILSKDAISSEKNSGYFQYFNSEILEWEIIETEEKLKNICQDQISKHPVFSVDVEFCSVSESDIVEAESRIKKVAASIQIATIDKAYFIDCLILHEHIRQYLEPLFSDEKYLKILHAPESDCNVLYRTFGIIINTIFDTAKFAQLNYDNMNSPGLGLISSKFLGFDLDKSFQVATWRARPLPLPMIEYGLTDAVILLPLFFNLISTYKTKNKGNDKLRMVWLKSNEIAKWIKFNKYEIKLKVQKI